MSLTRRDFLKASAAASALAGLGIPSDALAAQGARWVKSVCRYCGTGCGLLVGVRGGKVFAVQGDRENHNRGLLCLKGFLLPQILAAPDRCLHPLVRRDGRLVRASWDEALDLVARKLREAVEAHGPTAVGFYGSGQGLTEETYAANKLFKAGLRSNNVEGNPRLCMASAVGGYVSTYGLDEPMGCYEDIDHADVMLLIGSNAAEAHPILFERMARRKQTGRDVKVIVLDPRRTPTARIADLHLSFAPGTDLAILNAMANVLVAEGLVDEAFVKAHLAFGEGKEVTRTWEDYRAFLIGLRHHANRRAQPYDQVKRTRQTGRLDGPLQHRDPVRRGSRQAGGGTGYVLRLPGRGKIRPGYRRLERPVQHRGHRGPETRPGAGRQLHPPRDPRPAPAGRGPARGAGPLRLAGGCLREHPPPGPGTGPGGPRRNPHRPVPLPGPGPRHPAPGRPPHPGPDGRGLSFTAGSGTTFQDLCDHAGALNVAAEAGLKGHSPTPSEKLLTWNAEVLVISGDRPDASDTRARLAEIPHYRVLPAFKAGRFVAIPGALMSSVSHHRIEAYERLARALHPRSRGRSQPRGQARRDSITRKPWQPFAVCTTNHPLPTSCDFSGPSPCWSCSPPVPPRRRRPRRLQHPPLARRRRRPKPRPRRPASRARCELASCPSRMSCRSTSRWNRAISSSRV